MEYLTDWFACLRSTGGNLALAMILFLAATVAMRAANELFYLFIAVLLTALFAWRLVVWLLDVSTCSY